MKESYKKYLPFNRFPFKERTWADNSIVKAPIFASVDLRDGNQALINPMRFEEKLDFFKMLTAIGIKEIEIGFPSSSETEYAILRALIEKNLIPSDVTVQVLVQCREHLIRRTFDAIQGAKNVIIHFYNSTSALQRETVFKTDMKGIEEIAVSAARLIKRLGERARASGINVRYEYSPESFSGTETENAAEICALVMQAIGADENNKLIINLPATVELSTPNIFADQVEKFIKLLPEREKAIISIHPHNDRGTAVAAAELALLAGAERIEGTLFGNGERTGNVDLMILALNLYSQGINPGLDFSSLPQIRAAYERSTGMHVHERHPYAGDLVFTAFSGSHQDAINKGLHYMRETGSDYWKVPYLPIDPADIGRQYEPIIRINSQSGKGGAAFVMENDYGYILPKNLRPEFGAVIKNRCDSLGRELTSKEVFDIFNEEYVVDYPYKLLSHKTLSGDGASIVYDGILYNGGEHKIKGEGNGPIDAFFKALTGLGIDGFEFVSYNEHAAGEGSDAKAVAYIEIRKPGGGSVFGVGVDESINTASIKGVLSAVNRAIR